MIDAHARRTNYLDHLAPVWHALPAGVRGDFTVEDFHLLEHGRRLGLPTAVGMPDLESRRPILVASNRDEMAALGRPVILLEHGAGQHYGGLDASSLSDVSRPDVVLYLAPNPDVAERAARTMTSARRLAVGCPKLDGVTLRPSGESPTVGLAWHWPCRSPHPESDWAYPHFRGALPAVAARWPTVGTGHVRAFRHILGDYRRVGIAEVEDWRTALDRADLLVADNTSLMFEAAALGRPLAVMDHPRWRRGVEHGLRFWRWADLGPRTADPNRLVETIERAWTERDAYAPARAAMAAEVYGELDGRAAARSAAAILELL